MRASAEHRSAHTMLKRVAYIRRFRQNGGTLYWPRACPVILTQCSSRHTRLSDHFRSRNNVSGERQADCISALKQTGALRLVACVVLRGMGSLDRRYGVHPMLLAQRAIDFVQYNQLVVAGRSHRPRHGPSAQAVRVGIYKPSRWRLLRLRTALSRS